ncbi:hypothetical protein QTN47_05655 [Danxiaibacter flavus]|uniref:Uncharacterized protein n=1 Tax=Danxiaibacter flavus TaxID=3049108 RepID=A0ABV3ZAS3_9BACT|nr:hypothetical protein QNM32_05655 [Chitinophagaceae bacterium DXS]
MKKQILLVFVLFVAAQLSAQSTVDDDMAIIQSVFGKEKKELVGSFMALTGDTATKFWAVYDEYEAERKSLGKERFNVIKDYANQYASLTDEQAAALAKRVMGNDLSYAKMHEKYFKKVEKVVGGKNAAKFFQLESYIQNTIRTNVQNQIPFIGELEEASKQNKKS